MMLFNFKKYKFPRYIVKGGNVFMGANNINNVILTMKLLCDNDCPAEYIEFFESKRNKLGVYVLVPRTLSKIAQIEENEQIKRAKGNIIEEEVIEDEIDDGFEEEEVQQKIEEVEKVKVAEPEPAVPEVETAPKKTALKNKAEQLRAMKK